MEKKYIVKNKECNAAIDFLELRNKVSKEMYTLEKKFRSVEAQLREKQKEKDGLELYYKSEQSKANYNILLNAAKKQKYWYNENTKIITEINDDFDKDAEQRHFGVYFKKYEIGKRVCQYASSPLTAIGGGESVPITEEYFNILLKENDYQIE